MGEQVGKLQAVLSEVADLHHAAALIGWDERVCMPAGGVAAHGEMLATLQRVAHEKFISREVGELLADAKSNLDGADRDSDDARLVAIAMRDYDKAVRVPGAFVAEHARVTSAAQTAWIEARAKSDFGVFEPYLEKIVDLKKQYVTFFPRGAHPYDVLLDDFEPGTTTADVQAILGVIRPRQVDLIRRIAECPEVDDGVLHLEYADKVLWDFGVEVITAFGFDWERGRQDRAVHPFAVGIGPDDVRITTRFVEGQPFSLLFGTFHEAGHALYEQGIRQSLSRSALGGASSLGVHESQSRLWENLVGRSLPFWQHYFPLLQRRFPAQLGGATLEQFYRAINKVQPSLIRVEADEATYNLHVMLRIELEIALLNGDISVKDLPAFWDKGMKEYLGLVPADAASGVLQDIHWSAGLFGYFATYTLGNLLSAQLWERFLEAHPDRDELVRTANFKALLGWLREGIHEHGRKFQPQELVERVVGSRIDPAPYLRYLDTKYAQIYGL